MLTRIFKSGNSLAVRIPKELAFAPEVQEVEIDRIGATLVLRPSRSHTLAGLGELLASFSPAFMAAGRERHDEQERDWACAPHVAERGTPTTPERPGSARKRG